MERFGLVGKGGARREGGPRGQRKLSLGCNLNPSATCTCLRGQEMEYMGLSFSSHGELILLESCMQTYTASFMGLMQRGVCLGVV